MEFFYFDENNIKQGPYSERQMVDWFREGFFHDGVKIRFPYNGKEVNTTLGRMKQKNGNSTPFLFAKCDREELEKVFQKELFDMVDANRRAFKTVENMRNSMTKSREEMKRIMENMEPKVARVRALAERAAAEEALSRTESTPPPAPKPVASVAPTTVLKPTAPKQPKDPLPLVDLSDLNKDEPEIEDQKAFIRGLRDYLDTISLDAAQAQLKFPIYDKCRGCNQAAPNSLRAWICHITSQKHIDTFRQKGGRVTAKCFEWYSAKLEPFAKRKKTPEPIDEGKVDLEKKKLECFAGVIMPPVAIPLLHVDPSDTTRLDSFKGRQALNRLRRLAFDGETDRMGAAKSLHLPPTHCDVCNERFDYGPKLVSHIFTNQHLDKYLAMRGGFSQHDIDFWTELCNLFPEAGKDTRDIKDVRAQLRQERGKILDISGCKESSHYTIYGKQDRRRHVVDFISKQMLEHKRPVVVYMVSETPGRDMVYFIQTNMPGVKVDFVKSAEEGADLDVLVSDITIRLPARPHAIAFPYPPMEIRKQAEYAQRMSAEGVEANLIIAYAPGEYNELRKFSNRVVAVEAPATGPSTTVPSPPPTVFPTPSTTAPSSPPPILPQQQMPSASSAYSHAGTSLSEPRYNPDAAHADYLRRLREQRERADEQYARRLMEKERMVKAGVAARLEAERKERERNKSSCVVM